MRIAIIGGGAMGCLYAGYLSQKNEVILVDPSEEKCNTINENGVIIDEDGAQFVGYPKAVTTASGIGPVDVVALFVKALVSERALTQHRELIGEHTLLLTLQNGGGHEQILGQFAPVENIVIGTTGHNASVLAHGHIRHGGKGPTTMGMLCKPDARFDALCAAFTSAGFETVISSDIRRVVYEKLIINASSSVLTGILQKPQGFIATNQAAFTIAKRLITEICAVALADGVPLDVNAQIERVKNQCMNHQQDITSIYADLRDHRQTEVDYISGSIVAAGKRLGVATPFGEMAVLMVHAMEEK